MGGANPPVGVNMCVQCACARLLSGDRDCFLCCDVHTSLSTASSLLLKLKGCEAVTIESRLAVCFGGQI